MKILSFRRSILIIIILAAFSGLFYSSEDELTGLEDRYSFAIRYLGLKIADVQLIDIRNQEESRIEVKAKSVSIGNILFKINNKYIIIYKEDYIPQEYYKSIKQKGFNQEKTTLWFPSEKKMEIRIDINPIKNFHYEEDRFHDFFSALLYIRAHVVPKESEEIFVYANNNIWIAQIKNLGQDIVARKEAIKYSIDFRQKSNNKKQRSDVLTNNLVKEDSTLYLWFTDDDKRLPIQAEYDSSPFSVFWTLESYDISPVIGSQTWLDIND